MIAVAALLVTAGAPHKITNAPLRKLTSVGHDLPAKPDPVHHYLIYVHGKIIETRGLRPRDERFGIYEYEAILEALEKRGFVVISEARAKNSDPVRFAKHVADQVRTLIARGVAPSQITVVGASKGSVIVMNASTMLKNPKVNFVLMSNCNDWVRQNFKLDLYGRVLSIYDDGDAFAESCKPIVDASHTTDFKEVKTNLGIGHALLYTPRDEWVQPLSEWAAGSGRPRGDFIVK
jgi:hypothetical protein